MLPCMARILSLNRFTSVCSGTGGYMATQLGIAFCVKRLTCMWALSLNAGLTRFDCDYVAQTESYLGGGITSFCSCI